MSYLIRKAEIKDAPTVAKIHVETWQIHYRGQVPDEYLDSLSVEKRSKFWETEFSNPKPKTATFVVEKGGQVLGFCHVGIARDIPDEEKIGELYAIYLDSSKHGQGMGTDLMEAGLDFLRGCGFKKVILWVLKSNISTIGFYEARGWKSEGVEKKEEKNGFTFEEFRYELDL